MNEQELYNYLVAEYNHPFAGWDFSYLHGRREHINSSVKPWNYTERVVEAMQHAQGMLDIGTGGGELLAELAAQHALPPHACATEGYAPNLPIAQERLGPLGIAVYNYKVEDMRMPFADKEFDLIVDRNTGFDPREVLRILKPGGDFITQQIGDQTNREIHELLGRDLAQDQKSASRLELTVRDMQAVGWRIVEQQEDFSLTRFHDVGALVYYLKGLAWEVPDFSVEKYFPRLVAVDQLIEQRGYIDVTFHEFFIVAKR